MGAEQKAKKEQRFCPYCDEEIAESSFPYCQACEVSVFTCPNCKEPVERGNKTCPCCGAEIKG